MKRAVTPFRLGFPGPNLGSHVRGMELEAVVKSIEDHVLKAAKIDTFSRIATETRKTIVADGVRHEIDIFTEIFFEAGYTLRVIFECKNWSVPVGKNEIIIFSEKIRATSAQTGYFVAPAFTESARAQAGLDSRIRLLVVDADAPPWWGVDSMTILSHKKAHAFEVSLVAQGGSVHSMKDVADGAVRAGGREYPSLRAFLVAVSRRLGEQHVDMLDVSALAVGRYAIESPFAVVGQFSVGSFVFEAVYLNLRYRGEVIRPRIVASYDVATRGRVCRSEPVFFDGTWRQYVWIVDSDLVQKAAPAELPSSYTTSFYIEELSGEHRPSGAVVRTLEETLKRRVRPMRRTEGPE